jgi:hypothetical protein
MRKNLRNINNYFFKTNNKCPHKKSFRKDLRREASGSNGAWVLRRHWEFPCYSHTRDAIGPVFQPECMLVAVTLPQGRINDTTKLHPLLNFSVRIKAKIISLKM